MATANKKKAQEILDHWRSRNLKRMAVLDQFKLIQEGYQYCPVCDDIKTLANFQEMDNQIGYESRCKEHRTVASAGVRGPSVGEFLPPADLKDINQVVDHFNSKIDEALADEGTKRVPRALIAAIGQTEGVAYCAVCRYVHVPRAKEEREKKSKKAKK